MVKTRVTPMSCDIFTQQLEVVLFWGPHSSHAICGTNDETNLLVVVILAEDRVMILQGCHIGVPGVWLLDSMRTCGGCSGHPAEGVGSVQTAAQLC